MQPTEDERNSPAYVKPVPFRQDDAIWVQYINAATAEDDKMLRSWAESLDVLLVFSALFSAVVTSFLVNASKGLQRDNSDTTNYMLNSTNTILMAISRQLSSFNNGTYSAQDLPILSTQLPPFIPEKQDITVISLLYASLAGCIISAAGALIAKLWLIDYRKVVGGPGTAYDRALRRQRAYSGLRAWRLGKVIGGLPTLVLMSVILFYVALYQLMVPLQAAIGYGLGVGLALGVTFGFTTSVAAALLPNCPFKSPASRALRSASNFVLAVLPNDPLEHAWLLTCIGFMLCILVLALMAFVSSTTAVIFFIPLLVQYAIFRDVQDTGGHSSTIARRQPLVGLPFWVATSITIFCTATVATSYFSAHRFLYFGICIGICVIQSIQGPILVKAGVKIPDTAEIEALGWILEKEIPSESILFEKAALNADTDVRKAILSHKLFPLLPTLSSRLGQLPENERLERESYLNCMAALTFTPQKASFRTNEAAIMLPMGWEALRSELGNGLPNHCKERTEIPKGYRHQQHAISLDTGISRSSRQRDGEYSGSEV